MQFRLAGAPPADLAVTVWVDGDLAAPPRTLTAPGGTAVLPVGAWAWQATDGTRVSTGWNQVRVAAGGLEADGAVARATALAACQVKVLPAQRGAAVDQLAALTVRSTSLYRFDLRQGRLLTLPADGFFLAGFGPRGLAGISGPHSCGAGELLRLALPAPPSAGEHQLLVDLVWPEGLRVAPAALTLLARPALTRIQTEIQLPQLVVWTGRRALALFAALPAAGDRELVVRHPALRTVISSFAGRGGGATLLGPLPLAARHQLELEIDLRPLRPPLGAILSARSCGRWDQSGEPSLGGASCTLAAEQPLARGLRRYHIEGLDDGQHVISATINGEEVYGLGVGLTPYFRPGSEAERGPAERIVLAEACIEGRILRDGEPVAGEVRVTWNLPETRTLRFATDETLTYHWCYYGSRPPGDEDAQPGGDGHGDPRRGLWGIAIAACAEGVGCRRFDRHSSVEGGGHLDFELGHDVPVGVVVRDAATKQPLAHARLTSGTAARLAVLHYADGEASFTAGGEREAAASDEAGEARLVLAPDRRHRLVVERTGYQPAEVVADLTNLDDGALPPPLVVALHRTGRPEGEQGAGLRFLLGPEEPAARGLLIAFDADGSRPAGCRTTTRFDGSADLPSWCLDGKTIAFLHPLAALSLWRGEDLAAGGEITVPAAPARAWTVKVVDPHGEPVAGARLRLHLGAVVLAPADYLAVPSREGTPLASATDEHGLCHLVGLPPGAEGLVAVSLAGEPGSHPKRLDQARRGTLTLVRP